MKERKYKFEQPKNTEERIEAIYDELCQSPRVNGNNPVETFKDHLVAILNQLNISKLERKREKDMDNYSISFSLGVLAVLSAIFIFSGLSGSRDWEWLNNHRFAVRLWGVAFAAVFVGVSIERSSFFKYLWRFGFTKVVASLALSTLFIFCTGKSSSLINSVFGIDASAFPLTRALMSGLLAFQYSSPLLIVVAIFAIFYAIDVIGWLKSKHSSDYEYQFPPLNSFAFLGLALVVLIFSWNWINRDFSEQSLPKKVYRLAHLLDFNSKYSCTNIKKGFSVVFVGPDQSRVLVDMSGVKTENIESFVNSSISDDFEIPPEFFYLPCEVGEK